MLKASLSTIALAVLLAGCAAVGPDHQTPAVALDERFINAGASGVNAQAPGEDIAPYHSRQIALLTPPHWRAWLDASVPSTDLLAPCQAGTLSVSAA